VAGFEIDGERYEVPLLNTLNLRESQILADMTEQRGRIVQEDFEPADPTWNAERKREHVMERLRMTERPDFKRALAAIAYLRRHPEETLSDAGVRSENANALDFTIASILGPDDVDPTMRTSLQTQSSESETQTLETLEHSGASSETATDEQDTSRAITGTHE
jgi:hypothetical protein